MEKLLDRIKSARKRKGAFTVATIGDSVTQGCFEVFMTGKDTLDTVYESESSYGERLKSLLTALYPDLRVNLINAGLSGDTADGGLNRLDGEVLRFAPDLVIVSFGLNDCALNKKAGEKKYVDSLEKMFGKIKSAGAECVYLTQNYMNTTVSPKIEEPFLKKLAEEFKDIQKSGLLEEYFKLGKKTAKAYGVETVDIYGAWKKMEKGGADITELLANKLNHPVRELHYYTAIKILEKILGE